MYCSIPEIAEYLRMPVSQVQKYVLEGRIHSVYDGEQFLINKDQFTLYFKQLELIKEQIDEYRSEPLPPDRDIKDED
ncbi:excisionase family DNA-binding protein [Sporosarcina sp. FA9]|uniref:excisionase family DNA-binding protein n=1 Tax=Sporosarcina sp. FA9 TaxID=3413030 RepID=UPI003F65EB4D